MNRLADGSKTGLSVWRSDVREYNRATGNYRTVSFWAFRTADNKINLGYGTKREAVEAGRRVMTAA